MEAAVGVSKNVGNIKADDAIGGAFNVDFAKNMRNNTAINSENVTKLNSHPTTYRNF